MIKVYLFLSLFAIIGVSGYFGYQEYLRMQQTIIILETNNARLNDAVATQEEAMASLQNSYKDAQAELTTINAEYAKIRRQSQLLADKLERIDLTVAALNNPAGIERAVNRGSYNAGRCFELLSGAELNEKERTAVNGEAFNKECPWLYDTYKSDGLLETAAPTDTDIVEAD